MRSPAEDELIVRMARQGWKPRELATAFRRPLSEIRELLEAAGLPVAQRRPKRPPAPRETH